MAGGRRNPRTTPVRCFLSLCLWVVHLYFSTQFNTCDNLKSNTPPFANLLKVLSHQDLTHLPLLTLFCGGGEIIVIIINQWLKHFSRNLEVRRERLVDVEVPLIIMYCIYKRSSAIFVKFIYYLFSPCTRLWSDLSLFVIKKSKPFTDPSGDTNRHFCVSAWECREGAKEVKLQQDDHHHSDQLN